MEKWSGKVALVTDACYGLGSEITQFLVENNISVVGTGHRLRYFDNLIAALSDKKGKLITYQADLMKATEILKAVEWTEEKVGPIDIFVCHIGQCGEYFLSEARAEYNWKAANSIKVLKEVVSLMKDRKTKQHIFQTVILAREFHCHESDTHMELKEKIKELKNEYNNPASNLQITALPDEDCTKADVYKAAFKNLKKTLSGTL